MSTVDVDELKHFVRMDDIVTYERLSIKSVKLIFVIYEHDELTTIYYPLLYSKLDKKLIN